MPLRLVIFDLDDTLVAPNGTVAPGITELLEYLRAKGIRYAVVSNRARRWGEQRLSAAGIGPDRFYGRENFSAKKGSPEFFTKPCAELGVAPHEAVYVGHSKWDMITAAQARALFFNAEWAGSETDYGIRVAAPAAVRQFIELHLLKQHLWFASLDVRDARERGVTVRAMIDGNGGGSAMLKADLIAMLKNKLPVRGGRFNEFVANHLVTSVYLSELHHAVDYWTVYPGHKAGSGNEVLGPFLEVAARHFRDRFLEQLLVRHTTAEKSAFKRRNLAHVPFSNQTRTMHLNPAYRDQIAGRRLLVVDDFITDGHSMEWARNALLEAGAASVVCVGIGKYSTGYCVRTPKQGTTWEVFAPSQVSDGDFRSVTHTMQTDRAALVEFVEFYKRFAAG